MVLLLTNLALALYLTGVIWVVQLVHYPLFAAVGREHWPAYEAGHRARITVVVGVPMLAQPVAGALLLLDPPAGGSAALAAASLALATAMLLGTLAFWGPLHGRLEAAWDEATHRLLVRSNWLRTAGWTAQAGVLLALAAQVLG